MAKTDDRHSIVTRITAQGIWRSLAPVHIGGDDQFDSNVDMPLARDKSGNFYVPGASLAGATRNHLARAGAATFDIYRAGEEDNVLNTLFGHSLRQDKGKAAYASLLVFHEASAVGSPVPWVRDGVAIKPETGNARDKGKYNSQVLPAGTGFLIRLQLLLYDQLPNDVSEPDARQMFRWLLECFREEGVRIGGRTRKGFGIGEVDQWTLREFDLRKRLEALDWLEWKGWRGGTEIGLDDLAPKPLLPIKDRLTIQADFRIRTSLLVRAGGDDPNGPDKVQFAEGGQRLIPGTSLAGVLRHRIERIVNTTVGGGESFGRDLFGIANVPGIPESAGRVTVTEVILNGGACAIQSRVSIDRFTGGSLEARLFDEAPYWGASNAAEHLHVRITIDHPSLEELRFTLAAFKDLWLGDLPVGGEASVGRGVLMGVRAQFQDVGTDLPVMTWIRDERNPDNIRTEGAAEWRAFIGEADHE